MNFERSSRSCIHNTSFSSLHKWTAPKMLECLSLESLSALGNETLQLIGPISECELQRKWSVLNMVPVLLNENKRSLLQV
jgi:hypothetical protein